MVDERARRNTRARLQWGKPPQRFESERCGFDRENRYSAEVGPPAVVKLARSYHHGSGTSWLLDGLEVTLVGSLSGVLQSNAGLRLSDAQVTGSATTYLAGAVFGALFFGYLTDRLGRRKLFLVTLATYSLATVASAFSWSFLSFAIFRSLTGVGIGGDQFGGR